MIVKGIKGMNIQQTQDEVAGGGRFVRFPFCISLVVVSYRFSSPVYFIRKEENVLIKGLPFMLLSFFFGWWGIPWGPVLTASYLFTNISGGKDVTADMMKILHRHTNGHVFDFEKAGSLASTN